MSIILPDEEDGLSVGAPGIVLPDEPTQEREPVSGISTNIGQGVAIGAGAALSAFAVGRLFKWAFPGLTQPTKKAIWEIDRSLKKDFGGAGIKEHFGEYANLVRDTGQPVTFADFLASKNMRAPHTMKTLNAMLDEGGKPALIAEKLAARGEGKRSRVLESLAKELGIPEATFKDTTEELMKKKSDAASELYGAAFSNKEPIRDTRLLELFEKYRPSMEGALENAKEAFKFDPSKMVEEQTRSALASPRKDAWKFPIASEDVPEYLHIGQPQGGLQRYISPNIETLDRVKRALWALEQKRIREGAGDVGAIRSGRKDLTKLLDEIGPEEYKKARSQYAGDIALEEALETGKNVFKQTPEDLRKSLMTMGPDERQMLARGFYGHLNEMNDPRFVREVISGAPAYRKQRDILSAVFPDTQGLHAFLRNLEAEQAMLSGEKEFVKSGSPAQSTSALVDRIRAITSAKAGDPSATLFGSVHMPPWDPTGSVAKRGTNVLFGEPTQSTAGMSIPAGRDVYKYLRGWPSRSPMDMAIPGAIGAGAGYGAATMGSDWQGDLLRLIEKQKKRLSPLEALAEEYGHP